MESGKLIAVRGGGDIATGTICRLHRCGFRVVILETDAPRAIRRTVSLAEAVYDGRQTVEGVTAERVASVAGCEEVWSRGNIPVLIDPRAETLACLQPVALIDAILAKRNCGTRITMAEITIALGPGFIAGEDVHIGIETARGHDLGRVLLTGSALPNTGIPGAVEGFSKERVLYAPCEGTISVVRDIGSIVEKGEALAQIDTAPINAPFRGVVRGMLRDRSRVQQGLKIADLDPRYNELKNCATISDKARCISGGVLEALLFFCNTNSKVSDGR